MKIAVYQAPPTDGDVDAALRRLEVQLRAAALAGADVLVAPELYLPGYNRFDLHSKVSEADGSGEERREWERTVQKPPSGTLYKVTSE